MAYEKRNERLVIADGIYYISNKDLLSKLIEMRYLQPKGDMENLKVDGNSPVER